MLVVDADIVFMSHIYSYDEIPNKFINVITFEETGADDEIHN